jgi:Protein of unknown function (DUF2752)
MDRRDTLILTAPIAGVAALAALPPLQGGVSLCPVAVFTGVPCPGCGMTRAFSHLVNGDLSSALDFHPLVIPIVVIGALAWAWYLLRSLGRVRPIGLRVANLVLGSTGVALIAVWLARYAAGTLPPV